MIRIVVLSIALVTALCTNTECWNAVIHNEWEKCNVEDGSFETYVPLSKRNMLDLADLDVTIEKMFYTDVPVNEVSVLRFFVNRNHVSYLSAFSQHVPCLRVIWEKYAWAIFWSIANKRKQPILRGRVRF